MGCDFGTVFSDTDKGACDCKIMQATAVHIAGEPCVSLGIDKPPTTTFMGNTGMAFGNIVVSLETSTIIGSLLPGCLGGTPRRTLICNECCAGIVIGSRRVLLSIASCIAFIAASVASPQDADVEESIPNPILDIDNTVLVSVGAWCC